MKKTNLLSIIFLIFSATSVFAQNHYCENSAVRKIQRPLSSKNPQAGSFEYKFTFSVRENPDATLLIFIPGGPGQTSMGAPLSLPLELAVVRTDPRGVGCNQDPQLKSQNLNSEELARDVLAIVRELKPKRYILHGISYGTVVATMAAALAAEEKVPQPAAVVLEGVMGRAFLPNEYIEGYFKAWQNLKNKLSPEARQALSQEPLPFGFSSKEWAAWLSSSLIFGVSASGGSYSDLVGAGLATKADDTDKAILKAQINATKAPPSRSRIELYKEVICHELVSDIRDVKYDFDLVNGELVDSGLRLCQGIPLDRPYDSARYQIQSPVYYFSGQLDPATPPQHATYHFEHQTGPRTFISLTTGGHQALSTNLMDCSEQIWLAIDRGGEGFESALKKCSAAANIRLRKQN